jgi:beta-N-acetylhexosaminidase
MGLGEETLSPIGRDAITLLSPPSPDLVPSPPTSTDDIVIFTDGRSGLPCATCGSVPYIGAFTVQDTLVRLYGPSATGQITPWRVTSFTFAQLDEYLSTPSPAPTPTPGVEEEATPTPSPSQLIGVALQNAEWIVFAMLDPGGDLPQSGAVTRFLAEEADALGAPHLVVLAYDAPYYLDATEISKLSAYYVAYGRTDSFVEASVRALFGEFAPVGHPPVSVSGIDYDLLVQTSPDPKQTITLDYTVQVRPEEDQPTATPTEEVEPTPESTEEVEPTSEPRPEAGDELRLQTGVILDHNGHPVPDGTPVYFILTYPQEGLEQPILVATHGGVAETALTLDRPGQLDISIQADPVPRRIALQITIQEGEPVIISTPTPIPSPTPPPTPEPTTEPAPPPESTPQPTPETGYGDLEDRPTPEGSGLLDLAVALIAVFSVGLAGYYVVRIDRGPASRALRLALWCVVSGFVLYLAYALRLPGASWLREQSGVWAAGWATLFGGVVPLFVAWVLQWRKTVSEDG